MYYNSEHYPSPTEGAVLAKLTREERLKSRVWRLAWTAPDYDRRHPNRKRQGSRETKKHRRKVPVSP